MTVNLMRISLVVIQNRRMVMWGTLISVYAISFIYKKVNALILPPKLPPYF
jgi:hypothetical protein